MANWPFSKKQILLTYCRIDEQLNSQTGWGIQENSEYAELLNYWLHKLDQSGVKERVWKNWTFKATEDFWMEENIVLGFSEIAFAFLWVLGGIFLSLISAFGEKIIYIVKTRWLDKSSFGLTRGPIHAVDEEYTAPPILISHS